MVVCSQCGSQSEDDVPLGWMLDVGRDGRRSHVCDACARRYARAIEGKLDTDWW
jgi:hypothetical protein